MKSIQTDTNKEKIFKQARKQLQDLTFRIADFDDDRPWGGFFVIDESDASDFIHTFFPNVDSSDFSEFSKLSPKILLVEPKKRLSWQYHHRRAEIWTLVAGQAGIISSDTNQQTDVKKMEIGSVIELSQGERHRLVGLNEWGVIAEIWKHTDPENPSDEEDIVRVSDDFGR